MEVMNSSPYLPKTRMRDLFSEFKNNIAYIVWKKKLDKYGGINENTSFNLLDVGCGPGYFLRSAEKWYKNSDIYGIDVDESLIKYASSHLSRAKLSIQSGQKLPFADNTFDVITSLQVIEHLEKPGALLLDANRVLRPEGLLIISTPNPAGIPARMLKHKWHGYRHDHISLKTPRQWREIIENSGFRVMEDGTTGLTGFRILQQFPFSLINWIPLAVFGFFPWYHGESYMVMAQKK